MSAFEERGKPGYPGENIPEQSREPTNSTHMWRRVWELNPGNIGGKRVLSPLRHHCSPWANWWRSQALLHQWTRCQLTFSRATWKQSGPWPVTTFSQAYSKRSCDCLSYHLPKPRRCGVLRCRVGLARLSLSCRFRGCSRLRCRIFAELATWLCCIGHCGVPSRVVRSNQCVFIINTFSFR